jgi:hypothetical protein
MKHVTDEGGVNTFPVFSTIIDVGTCCIPSIVRFAVFTTWLEFLDSPWIVTLCGKQFRSPLYPSGPLGPSVPLACPPFTSEVLHYDPLWSRAPPW